jgi:DNA polymerase
MLTAGPGRFLLCADFSNIEGRVAAWGAGEAWKVEAFEDYDRGTGPDLYKLAYAKGFHKDPGEVTKAERQVGKVMELALQYQGWKGAFQSMAEVYGVEVDDDRAAELCGIWREIHPAIRSMWYGLEDAAKKAVRTGEPHRWGNVVFGMRDGFLFMRLPSGRLLAYYRPGFMTVETPYEKEKEILTFWGVSSQRDKVLKGSPSWGMLSTYGGKLFENYCQAVARDVMREAMARLDAAGFPILLTVHDEIIAELPEAEAVERLGDFEALMSALPGWCEGLPVSVEGWVGFRYRK